MCVRGRHGPRSRLAHPRTRIPVGRLGTTIRLGDGFRRNVPQSRFRRIVVLHRRPTTPRRRVRNGARHVPRICRQGHCARAEHVHRHNDDVPEEIIAGLAELGAFGLSVPSEYGGFSEGGDGEYMASCIATEELSRASLGIGGSLITRPEILTRALVKGGTEAQKNEWLP
ncbi:MAG: acyl-CoA dehydrogenase family protein, partial [Actinobacteria bacterium]|nr:acyl-CoA dehydrogenase family protein [Actinomycetota bacterium]